VVVGHGPRGSRPAGRLPVFTTNTREEAELLITLACPMNYEGQHIAPELAEEQTLANLDAFGHRLASIYFKYIHKQEAQE
jgi:hypothetical protein